MKKTKKEQTKKITKKMSFAELMESRPEAAETLFEMGMHCIGCPAAAMETIEQGAEAHGIDADELIEKLNKTEKRKK